MRVMTNDDQTDNPVQVRKPLRRENSNVDFVQRGGEVKVIVTQAFGPNGDSLIGVSDVTFDGHPALTLKVRAGDREGLVHLSPIHGDPRKSGFTDIEVGTKCELLCPTSGDPLPKLPDVPGDEATTYYGIYLTPDCSERAMAGISDIWGHYHSRVVDNYELISTWMDAEAKLGG